MGTLFNITKSPTFWMTVVGEEQSETGRRVEFRFDLRVKRITFPELQDVFKVAAAESLSDFDAIKDLVVDWRGVGADDSTPIPYSPESLKELMSAIGGQPVVRALMQAMPKAKEKN